MVGGKKKGVSVACLSPSLCLSGAVSFELSEGGVWHQTQWVAHHLQCSRQGRKVGEVPQLTPLQSFVVGPGLEDPWLQGQSVS